VIGRRSIQLVMSAEDSRRVLELVVPLLAANEARRRRRRVRLALAASPMAGVALAAGWWLARGWP